jgi:hypothetical protein
MTETVQKKCGFSLTLQTRKNGFLVFDHSSNLLSNFPYLIRSVTSVKTAQLFAFLGSYQTGLHVIALIYPTQYLTKILNFAILE